MAHVAEHKKMTVTEFGRLLKEYPIVGAVNMENIPSPQLQKMRASLRGKVILKVTKRRLLKIALEQAEKDKKGISKLIPYLEGMPALIFTKDNPFALYKKLQKNKSDAPAKVGQKAPKDIVVPAGPTPFAPGPIISELAQVGIKSKVDNNKIAVVSDTVVVRKGEEIKAKVASILTRLGIKPMEIGLDLVAAYEDGDIMTKEVLDIDEAKFAADVAQAAAWATNLSVNLMIVTKDSISLILTKATRDARALAIEQGILADEVKGDILARAEAQAQALKAKV
ncbi:50S ribosomal protein L10 [Candidatus Woesearchaeota archaeon]|nr:50S ribosomal protein L10 [Candidatus Woesearchaeota archaeon]